MTVLFRIVSVGVLAGSLCAGMLQAQAGGPGRPGLISEVVNESSRVVLSGNVHPLATRMADRGAVDPATPAARIFLLLRRSPEQEAALRAAIEAMHDRNSPSFHKWLTPEEFGAKWGAADSDIAAVTAWLESHGFSVAGATAGKTGIEFSGSAGQIQSAFHTTIHAYMVDGVMHHANASDPQIPSALAPVVGGISTLNDFHPRALARRGPRGVFDAQTRRIRPELTASGSFGNFLYVGPADAATIYNSPIPALNPAAAGPTVDGTGTKIGIIGDSAISTLQNSHYRQLFGLPAKPVTVILDGSTNPGENGDAVEAYLDTEVANGIAPGASVYYYVAADTNVNYGVDLATSRAVNDNLVDVLNLSFSECEAQLGTSGNAFYAGLWEQAAAQGITVTVSTGDSGSAGCDDPDTQTEAYYGLQVSGLASTPFNIAVGGTDFAALAGPDGSGADFTNYVSTTNDATTLRSALGAIPEVPWNDAVASFPPGPIGTSIPFATPYANIVAAGGGKSNCSEGGVASGVTLDCTAAYAKPSWQSAPGVPADKVRDLPDVSLFAANGLDYASWGICTDQDTDASGNPLTDCTPGSNGLPANQFYVYGVGGTSASAPAFAGVMALVRQKTGERQGLANYVLYHLARNGSAAFRDVTTGNNTVPCSAGSPDCSANDEDANLLTGYNAGTGYDLATGLGSVDISTLLADWASVGLSTSTTLLTLSPVSIQHGQVVTADVTVTAASGTATGPVALNANANPPSLPGGVALGNYSLISGGTTGSLALNSLPGGSYNVIATYGGSAAVAQSVSAPVSVTVAPESSTTVVNLAAYNPATLSLITSGSMPYGYVMSVFATPHGDRSPTVGGVLEPDGQATGTITFTEGTISLGSEPIGLSGYATAEGLIVSPGTYTVSAAYHGDNSFDASTGTAPLVVTPAATQATLSASTTTFKGQPIVFTVTLTTQSAGTAPGGQVQLKSGSTVLAQAPLSGTAASLPNLASGTATISTSNVPSGKAAVEVVYLGDANYAGSTTNAIEIQGKPNFVVSNVSMTLVGEHTTGANSVPVTSEGGYTGTVKLTCVLVTKTATPTPPECAMDPASVTLTANGTAQPVILIFGKGTTLPVGITVGASAPAKGGDGPLVMGFGGAGLILVFGIRGVRARRRAWWAVAPILLLLTAFLSLTACTKSAKMITAGQYTFNVTGVDSADSSDSSTGTITVRVL
jgi:hypothetical protein